MILLITRIFFRFFWLFPGMILGGLVVAVLMPGGSQEGMSTLEKVLWLVLACLLCWVAASLIQWRIVALKRKTRPETETEEKVSPEKSKIYRKFLD